MEPEAGMAGQGNLQVLSVGGRMVDQRFEQLKSGLWKLLAHGARPAAVGGPHIKEVAHFDPELVEQA